MRVIEQKPSRLISVIHSNFVTIQHFTKFEVLLYTADSSGSGLSHLCIIQGRKAKFSSLNEHFLTRLSSDN